MHDGHFFLSSVYIDENLVMKVIRSLVHVDLHVSVTLQWANTCNEKIPHVLILDNKDYNADTYMFMCRLHLHYKPIFTMV